MSLTLFSNNGIEIVVDTRTGEAFTTQNGYIKLSGKPKQTVAARLDRLVANGKVAKTEIATAVGAKTFKLIPAAQTLNWLQRDRQDLAADVTDATAYLHKLAGYTQPVKVKRQRKPKAVEVEPIILNPIIKPAPVVLPTKFGSLQRFDRDGIELVIDTRTGKAFTSVRGYARMSGKAESTIRERSNGARKGEIVEAEIPTAGGLQGARLIPAKIVFQWMVKDNPELAMVMGEVGATVYIHQLAGYTQPVKTKRQRKAKLVEGCEKETVLDVEIQTTTGLKTRESIQTKIGHLQRFESPDGIELVINTQTGEAFSTQNGYSRMSGLTKQTISERLKKLVRLEDTKTAEIDTGYGVKLVRLIPAKICFKWAIKDNPELAEAMGTAGATVYIHQLAGFKVTSDAIAKPASEPTPPPTEPEQTKLGSTTEQTVIALMPLRLLMSSVPSALVDGYLLNEVQRYHPELKHTIDAAHTLLAATNPVPEILLTPTAIGERLGISARAVNTLLTNGGYQIKNQSTSKTEPAYLPTEKGKQHSMNTLATGRGSDNTTYQHIKWVESIIDELRMLV